MTPYDAVPSALAAIPRWLLWKRVRKPDGSLVKVPQNRLGTHAASAHASSTWMSFDEAVRQVERQPAGWGGIGFALRADDDIGVVDLDGCRDPSTDAITAWAQKVLDLFESAYVELSPSATGFHIVARGAPAGLHSSKAMDERILADRDPWLEAFSERQYITITGDRVSGSGMPSLPEAWDQVESMLGAVVRAPKAKVDDADLDVAADALRYFSSDDVGGRSGFVGIGIALKDAFGDQGFEAWAEWMARSDNDEGEDANRALWESLPDESAHISLATIFWRARKAGWKAEPLDFDAEVAAQQAAPIVDISERRRIAPIRGHRE